MATSIALTCYPFSDQSVGEAQWNAMAKWWLGSGVRLGELDEFEVFADSSGMQVKVNTGRAWGYAQFIHNDTLRTLDVVSADDTLPRIDRVVLRINWGADAGSVAVVTGTAADPPSAPTLSRTGTVWEFSLAQVLVDAAATTIATGKITDERADPDLCGYSYSPFPTQVCLSTSRPTEFAEGGLIYESDTNRVYVNTGTTAAPIWVQLATGSSSAPTTAPYVTTASDVGLSNEQVLGSAVIMQGILADRPVFGTEGRIYFATDDNGGTLYRDNGASWTQIGTSLSGSGAPTGASYVTTVTESGLSNEQVLGTAVIMADVFANRPAASVSGRLFFASDTGTLYRDNGATWAQVAAATSGAYAPTNASFVTTAAESSLSAEKVLGTDVIMSGVLGSRPAASINGRLYFATDVNGGTLYRDSGSVWVQVTIGLSGAVGSTVPVYKTADQSSVNNTLADDAELLFPVAANEKWVGQLVLNVTNNGDAGVGFKDTFSVPTGGAITHNHMYAKTAAGTMTSDDVFSTAGGVHVAFPWAASGSNGYIVLVYFSYIGGANAGNVVFRWAQNVTTPADPAIVHAGSYLIAWKA